MNLTNLNNKSDEELRDIAAALQALSDKNKYNKLQTVFPDTGPMRRELYGPAVEFMNQGKDKRFRVFMGGNRSGKSFTCATELVFHMTGEYPSWWQGKVFKKPTTFWIVAESGALFRDSMQRLLFGDAGEEIGTGLLPLASKNSGIGIVDWYALAGTPGGIGSCTVKHKNGHMTSLVVKTNEMTREQFQAAKVDFILFDEEPKIDIYLEALMRLMAIGKAKEPGSAVLAFTPQRGFSEVVLKFLPNGQFPIPGHPLTNKDQYVCRVEWNNAPHLSEQEKATMRAQIPAHLLDAKERGIPLAGAGRIYPVQEKDVVVAPFDIPDWWPRAYGLDFGWHITAAVWGAKDPTTGIIYLYSEYYQGERIPEMHALSIKAKGDWIPGICDPSGSKSNAEGKLLIDLYEQAGLTLTPGENSILVGLARVLALFETGQLKIFSNLENLINEFRLYRYDKNNPNKPADHQADHAMDAMKYLTSLFDYIALSKEDTILPHKDDMRKPRNLNRDPLTGY